MPMSLRKLRELKRIHKASKDLLRAKGSNLLLAKSDEHLELALKLIAEVIAIEVE